jgi:hypothetical protein
MRFGALALVLASGLGAQTASLPSSTASGVVLERDAQNAAGEFSIRLDTFEVIRYRYDAATKVMRDGYPTPAPALRPGDRVEVKAEPVAGSLLEVARLVTVTSPAPRPPAKPKSLRTALWENFSPEDPVFGRGDLSLSGVIAHVSAARLVLHTREGERTILLRDDTRYLENGELASAAALQPNMRVFVRAGRNLYNEFEGYQVVWGSILEPK